MMSRINELQLRDVRCFKGTQTARLGKITLLVGENSTGKSTFLGCYKTFAKYANLWKLDDDDNYFDEDPFYMGGFGTIVRSGSQDFSVGGSFEGHCHKRFQMDFVEGKDGVPAERKTEVEFERNDNKSSSLVISCLPEKAWNVEGPDFQLALQRSDVSYARPTTWLSRAIRYDHLPFRESTKNKDRDEFTRFSNFFRKDLPLPRKENNFSLHVKALEPAPPPRERTQDFSPIADIAEPENYLSYMGQNLDLFSGIKVQVKPGGLFEILVERNGLYSNIMDVGYGVHSVLPLLMSMYLQPADTVFLLQQPEVHLHPSIQAELAQVIVDSGYGFVIETHSDQVIDRLRICVMREQIAPEDLSIIYFEPGNEKQGSTIHNISVDGEGNLLGAPTNYRKFFTHETEALLGLRA